MNSGIVLKEHGNSMILLFLPPERAAPMQIGMAGRGFGCELSRCLTARASYASQNQRRKEGRRAQGTCRRRDTPMVHFVILISTSGQSVGCSRASHVVSVTSEARTIRPRQSFEEGILETVASSYPPIFIRFSIPKAGLSLN
jgi:hypothetical protein